jgi:leucyl-tRNA synthetase
VEQKEKEQWMLAITKYADRLYDDLDTVDYPERVKVQQKNWIGRSEGALIKFDDIEIFTTRPDTIFGATFVVIAGKEDRFTGKYVTNPATKEKIPVWEAEYVMSDYGTGAIMGVPADDERDMEFAKKYKLPIIKDYEKAGFEDFGKKITKYKLRDWVFSRQRYWGEPIPVIHCEKCGMVPVPEKSLPVELPVVEKYEPGPDGESPLDNIKEWVNVKCPKCGGEAKRETDVMPNWAGSSWYFLRYCDDKNDKEFASRLNLDMWMPVDWYNGGMEHTVLHLLYSRFWNKFLYDLKLVPTSEPYKKRTSHGIILAEGGEKMSKSKGNVINPDAIVEQFGADTLRLYEMFMGPFEQAIAWSESALIGPRRFLEKVWRLREKVSAGSSCPTLMHQTIKKVSEDIESMGFNTAVSSLMIYVNALEKQENISKKEFQTLLLLLAPFAPHITEELWSTLGVDHGVPL